MDSGWTTPEVSISIHPTSRKNGAEVDNAFDNPDTITGTTTNASTTTAVSSASYQGATLVTINIYLKAPVVGDGGMRRFAQMAREEFECLDCYSTTI